MTTSTLQAQHTPQLLKSHLKTLRMPTMLRESTTVARQIGAQHGSYELYLQQLAELEQLTLESHSRLLTQSELTLMQPQTML